MYNHVNNAKLRLFSDDDARCEANVEVIASSYISSSSALLVSRADFVDVNVIEKKRVCRFFFPITSDKNISTCIDAVEGHEQLQGIFTSSTFPESNRLSIEVTLMNVDDCNSPAWTWFVGSECNEGVHTECSSTQITQTAEFTTCGLTCHCLDLCNFLYLKYNHFTWRNQTSEKLCEIWAQRSWTICHIYTIRFNAWSQDCGPLIAYTLAMPWEAHQNDYHN